MVSLHNNKILKQERIPMSSISSERCEINEFIEEKSKFLGVVSDFVSGLFSQTCVSLKEAEDLISEKVVRGSKGFYRYMLLKMHHKMKVNMLNVLNVCNRVIHCLKGSVVLRRFGV